jgi:hypothetical protein
MKVAEGRMASKNKIVDAKITYGQQRYEKVEEQKRKLERIEERIMTEDREGRHGRVSGCLSPHFSIVVQKSQERKKWEYLDSA